MIEYPLPDPDSAVLSKFNDVEQSIVVRIIRTTRRAGAKAGETAAEILFLRIDMVVAAENQGGPRPLKPVDGRLRIRFSHAHREALVLRFLQFFPWTMMHHDDLVPGFGVGGEEFRHRLNMVIWKLARSRHPWIVTIIPGAVDGGQNHIFSGSFSDREWYSHTR